MDDRKKLILASALFVVALGLIGWYMLFAGADSTQPLTEPRVEVTDGAKQPRSNARLPAGK